MTYIYINPIQMGPSLALLQSSPATYGAEMKNKGEMSAFFPQKSWVAERGRERRWEENNRLFRQVCDILTVFLLSAFLCWTFQNEGQSNFLLFHTDKQADIVVFCQERFSEANQGAMPPTPHFTPLFHILFKSWITVSPVIAPILQHLR